MTPQEAWSGKKPSVSHLRIFESIAYSNVNDEKRVKLDDKNEKLVFIGYDSRSKGYKLYNPINGKVIISRDVVFDEEDSWAWDISSNEETVSFPLVDGEPNQVTREDLTPPTSPNSSRSP